MEGPEQMAGRRPVLDDAKQREIWPLSVGCSRADAARYVGCAVSTILNTARRQAEFAERLRHAEMGGSLTPQEDASGQ